MPPRSRGKSVLGVRCFRDRLQFCLGFGAKEGSGFDKGWYVTGADGVVGGGGGWGGGGGRGRALVETERSLRWSQGPEETAAADVAIEVAIAGADVVIRKKVEMKMMIMRRICTRS
jgi:hypothetical protein